MKASSQKTSSMRLRTALLVLPFIALTGAPAMSQAAPAGQTEVEKHKACIAKIDTDAKGAYEDALQWMTTSGDRPAARHCAALALIELGHYGEGAARLEELANASDSGTIETRAVYLAQSGNAWLLARRPEAAILTLSNAMKLSPGNNDLLKDRARAFMMQKEWEDAGADLDAANKILPTDSETLRLRATVLKELKRLPEAWSDVETAMAIAPSDVKVLVVRGDVREAMRLAGLPDPIDRQVTSQPDVVRPTIIGN